MGDPQVALLERDAELHAIARQLDGARDRSGSLVMVEGPAGIGKTRLLQEAMAMAGDREMSVLRARGGVLEQHLEYGVVRQLVEHEVLGGDPEQRAALLAGAAAPAAAVLGIGEPPTDTGPGYDPSNDILHGLQWLLANLAERGPLLAVIDDAHWADAGSLRAAGHLAHRLGGLGVALLVAARTDEPGSQTRLLTDSLGHDEASYLRPAAFSTSSVGTVLTVAFGGETPSAELVAACAQTSGGNAFLLTELSASLAGAHDHPGDVPLESVGQAGPLAVRRSLLLRLGRLGGHAHALAGTVAALGGEAELRHAAAIAALEPAIAAEAADTLMRAGILEDREPLRMVHPLIRAAVVEETPAAALAATHRRAFEVMRADGVTDRAALAHALNAEPSRDAELVELLRRTADVAARTGTPDTAVVHLDRALQEPPSDAVRPDVLAELGRAQVRAGAFADGLERLDQALALSSDPSRRVAVHRDRAFAAFASAGMGEARRLVHDAVQELGGPGKPGDDALQLEADLALLAWLSGSEHGFDMGRHRELPGDTRAQRTLLALLAQERHASGSHPNEVIELAQRALGDGRLIEEDTSESLAWYMATYALLTCEAHGPARATIDQALADGTRRGSVFARAGALGTRAVLALNEGRPRDAEADARTAAAGAIPPIMVPVNASYIVLALVDQGDLGAASVELEKAGLEHGPGGPTVLRWVPWARARLREAQRRPVDVETDVAALEEDDRAGRPMRALAWRALLARSLQSAGEADRAQALADEHLDWAQRWGRPAALGVARRAAALARPGDARIARLEEAAATLAGSALRTEEARARADLGIALLRAGRRLDGRRSLESALELALGCGARGTAEAVASELEVAGAPPRHLAFDELTASERRVAEVAAGGATNREIAQELFVTAKTVENHLTRVYAKLGIDSRDALEGALRT